MHKNIAFCAVFSGFIALTALTSCNDEGAVGLNLIPNDTGLALNQSDTFTVNFTTQKEDSIRTSTASLSLLGAIEGNGNLFGNSFAAFATNFHLPTFNLNFGDSLSVDSVVLSFRFDGYYGDTTSNLKIEVLELENELRLDSPYFSNQIPKTKSLPLGVQTLKLRPSSAVQVNEVVNGIDSNILLVPSLRIHLNKEFGNRILEKSGGPEFASNEAFKAFFQGIFVKASRADFKPGSVAYLNLSAGASFLSVYYKQGSARRRIDFVMNAATAKFNSYNHNYQGAEILQAFDVENAPNGRVYIQSMAGAKALVKFPYIQELAKDKNVIINKAELVIKIVPGVDYSVFKQPARLVILGIDQNGNEIVLDDQFDSFFDGNYNEANQEYRINISRYIQGLATGKPDYGIYIFPGSSGVNANRLVFANQVNPILKSKLVLTLSNLNK